MIGEVFGPGGHMHSPSSFVCLCYNTYHFVEIKVIYVVLNVDNH